MISISHLVNVLTPFKKFLINYLFYECFFSESNRNFFKQAYNFSDSSLEEANEDSDDNFQISYNSYLCKQTSPERANLNLIEEIQHLNSLTNLHLMKLIKKCQIG